MGQRIPRLDIFSRDEQAKPLTKEWIILHKATRPNFA